jgi:hypothetical protein
MVVDASNLRRRRLAGTVLLGCSLVAIGCSSLRPPEPEPTGTLPLPRNRQALQVSLVFGDAADLDLYVTDPVQETVYFANSPSRSGGSLEGDRRCDAPAPRVEVVRFEWPSAGRYRIGVDYPERCRAANDPIPFLVVIDAHGQRHERRGMIELGQFQPIVVETILAPGPDQPQHERSEESGVESP